MSNSLEQTTKLFLQGTSTYNGVEPPREGVFEQLRHHDHPGRGVDLFTHEGGTLLSLTDTPTGIAALLRFPSIQSCGEFPHYHLLTAQAHLVTIVARLLPDASRLWIDCEASAQHRAFALSNRYHFYTAEEVRDVLQTLKREVVLL